MKAWDEFIRTQEKEIGTEAVLKWLRPLKVVRFDARNLYLEAKDQFQSIWFEEHMRPKVLASFENGNKARIKVHLTVAKAPSISKSKTAKLTKKGGEQPRAFALSFDSLDPLCTLDQFVVSSDNFLTCEVFRQLISGDPPEGMNPVYVYGASGTGKTHLLMAYTAALREQGKRVVYARAETFADHVVSAIRAGEMSAFRQAYRNTEALVIEDVHLLARKGATQEEFFHTFNTLQAEGKQIVLSANRSPAELQLIEPRLVSRFEWGIVLALEPPQRPDAEKILKAKAKALNFSLHSKVLDFLLDSFATPKSFTRALEALILRLHMKKDIPRKEATAQATVLLAKQLLVDLLREEEEAALTPQWLTQASAEYFGIKADDIVGKAQTRECVLPRQIAMHLCRTLLKLPYAEIGRLFGRDHSTVMSSVKAVQRGVDADDAAVAGPYRALLRKVKSPRT